MRILICDEDISITEQLQKYIKTFFKNNHLRCPEIVCFSDAQSVLADSGEKDILFLDIIIQNSNGLFIGNELKKQHKNLIIFIVTAFSEYLDDAMRFQVFRYLSKPINPHRLFRNLKDAIDLYNSITIKIPIETKQGVYTLPTSSIISIEARERLVIVHTTLRDFNSLHNMLFWREQLPRNHFFQSHRSFIINYEHITDFDRTLIHLTNNNIAYLTRRKYSSFKDAYLLYLGSRK